MAVEEPPQESPPPDGGAVGRARTERTGLSERELEEATRLFDIRVSRGSSGCGKALTIEDIDLLLRQLRLFMSVRLLWALVLEIDENANGKIEVDEFLVMVAKLRGRKPPSPEFYVRSLPRAIKEQFCKVFEILDSDEDGLLDREGLTAGCRQLHGSLNVDSDDFKQAVEDVNSNRDEKFSLTDFLVLQAKLRKQPPEVDVAILSLTPEEHERFAQIFRTWQERSRHSGDGVNLAELRQVTGQLGYPVGQDQLKRLIASVELDGLRPITLRDFLFFLVSLGAGSSEKARQILTPGASYETAFKLGFQLEELWELGYDDLLQIRQAGWSAQAVVKAGLAQPFQLRQVGYSAAELRKIGCSAKQLKLAGFSLEELRNTGFSVEVLRECCSVMSKHRGERFGEDSELILRPITDADVVSTANRTKVSVAHGDMRWWSTPRIKSMLDGVDGSCRLKKPSTAPPRL